MIVIRENTFDRQSISQVQDQSFLVDGATGGCGWDLLLTAAPRRVRSDHDRASTSFMALANYRGSD